MTTTDPAAPLAVLEDTIGTPVTVRTKAGQLIDGILAGYDEHLNLTLDAAPATDDHETADEPGTSSDSDDDEHEPPTRAVDAPDTTPSPALAALKAQLEPTNLTIDIGAEEETLIVTKLGQEYRIHPDGTVEGDGLHRQQLEQLLTD